jgi:LacI family transcriptional regulator
MTLKPQRIALLFNGNKMFDREVLAGIADYLSRSRAQWDLFLEEDFRLRMSGFEGWQGDGIIADFDDPQVAASLRATRLPLVGVGGSYRDDGDYPAGVPYVATDNGAIVKLAYDHLIAAGLRRFAMFSLPEAPGNRWAQEREKAFAALVGQDGMAPAIFRGRNTSAPTWDQAVQEQIAWLHSLPKPVGIVAVTDARARQLLQACTIAGIAVPEQVALIGIDNDPLAHVLTQVPMSSVIQGAADIGRTAAHLLGQLLRGVRLPHTRILVPPKGINAQASTRHAPLHHPNVMLALHYIRLHACLGIKTDQVAHYVGISRSALEAQFRQQLDRSVHDEILRAKLGVATALLRQDDCKLADVALQCGFTSNAYMHSVFKREFGCSPRAWQQRAQHDVGDVIPG